MPLTIAICDDNEDQIKELRRLLGEWSADKSFALNIDEYISAESFLFSYPDKPCDLILLDIEMKRLNGMELAQKLRSDGNMLPEEFVFCHRSYIVNMRYVRSIVKTDIMLDSGEKIPLSRRLYKEVNEKFIRYYMKG